MILKMIKIITYTFLCFCFFFKLFTVAKENSDVDISYTAGVETVLDIEIPIKTPKEKSVEKPIEPTFDLIGYTTARVNIREEPSTDSNIMNTLPFNIEIQYAEHNEEWVLINYENKNCYVYKKYIADNPAAYTSYDISNSTGFKSYMSYKAITDKVSKQYKLQQRAYTGNYGIRMVDDRYCAVIGSYFQKEVGTYFDLVLENGTVIKCILGDIKSEKHTYEDNITSFNGCVSEFIVDSNLLVEDAKITGNMSKCNNKWNSPVVKINFYDE